MGKKIVEHPPSTCLLQLIVDGTIDEAENDNGNGNVEELTAILLLRVNFPLLYPFDESSLPIFNIEYFICTDRNMLCTPDKPLDSLAHLDEIKLKKALVEEARQMLPDPCVYMVVTACLVERLFEFIKMSVQGRHVL